MSNKTIRVGILITKPRLEAKKDELVCYHRQKRPWLKDIPKTKTKLYTTKNKKVCVPGDVSVGLYMLYKNPGLELDFIPPEEITHERLKKNTINFMVIFDLLESFHSDKGVNKNEFKNLAETLLKAKNIYPNFSFQKLINDKSNYISYFAKKKIKVIPTFKVLSADIKQSISKTTKKIIKEVEKRKHWNGKFITKPIFGQESIDFYAYTNGLDGNNKSQTERELTKYFEKIVNGSKVQYPGVIIQKYIEGFDKKNPEIRMYYFNGYYKYSVITHDGKVSLPTTEKGKLKINNFEKLLKFSKKVLNNLPHIKVNGTILPKALIRIDVACNIGFKEPFYLNEVEFVPSMYVEDVKTIPEIYLGDAFLKILKIYTTKKRVSKNNSR